MALELEHMIGFSGASRAPLHVHPNGSDVIYTQGGSVIIADLRDPHKQCFLRGHDNAVTCLALSSSGKYIVSGQVGDNADVIVWDFATQAVKYRFQEHDHGVETVALSADEVPCCCCCPARVGTCSPGPHPRLRTLRPVLRPPAPHIHTRRRSASC